MKTSDSPNVKVAIETDTDIETESETIVEEEITCIGGVGVGKQNAGGNPDEKTSYIPSDNKDYYEKEYWEQRFAEEESYDWLLTYIDIQEIINELIPRCPSCNTNTDTDSNDGNVINIQVDKPEILMVGCGNSTLSESMYDDGYTNITNIDYSSNVIRKMKKLHQEQRPDMQWREMDMTNLNFGSADINENDINFDVIFDKAAMDALCTCEGSVWHPKRDVVEACHKMCLGVTKYLKPGGLFLQISFAQPHFRRKYLNGSHFQEGGYNYGWSIETRTLTAKSKNACFDYFLYIMKKENDDAR